MPPRLFEFQVQEGGMVRCPVCHLGAFAFGKDMIARVRVHPGGRLAAPTRGDSQCHYIRGCGTQLEVIVEKRAAA